VNPLFPFQDPYYSDLGGPRSWIHPTHGGEFVTFGSTVYAAIRGASWHPGVPKLRKTQIFMSLLEPSVPPTGIQGAFNEGVEARVGVVFLGRGHTILSFLCSKVVLPHSLPCRGALHRVRRTSALGNAQAARTGRHSSILGNARGTICVAGLRNSIIPTQILGVRYSDLGFSKLRKTQICWVRLRAVWGARGGGLQGMLQVSPSTPGGARGGEEGSARTPGRSRTLWRPAEDYENE
jgi:hypothetical protein